jgi:hypothetical protein
MSAPVNPFSVEALSSKALEMLGADMPTADSVLRVAAKLAQLVNKAPGLHGPEKAALVQQVLREILNSSVVRPKLDAAAVDALNVVIDTVVPTALTLIISAGRGEFDLKKPREAILWCCRSAASVAVAAAAAHTAITEKAAAPEQVEAAVVAPAPAPAPAAAPAPEAASDANIPPTESSAPAEPPVETPAAPSTN